MELTIFISILIFSFLILIFSNVLPVTKWIVLIAGFSFIAVGVISIGQGVSIGSTVLQSSFTNSVGLMLSLFGLGISINSILENVKYVRVGSGG